MKRLYERSDDFEGVVRILTEREGGRPNPPYNGIRWDLRYFSQAEDKPRWSGRSSSTTRAT